VKRKKSPKGDAAAKPAKGGGKLMPAAVLAVGMLGGGFFMGGGNSAPAPVAAAPAAAEEPAEEAHAAGPIVEAEPITVNLSDGHYLKVGLALQMAAPEGEAAAEGGGGHGGGEAEAEPAAGLTARALDEAIALFPHHSMEELTDLARRAEVKEHLAERIREVYTDEVTDVYFTEFVMQ